MRPLLALVVSVIAAASYVPVFSRFPETRDFPWVNLALLAAAGLILAVDWARARSWRTLVSAIGAAVVLAIFAGNVFWLARQLPPAENAPRVGQAVPAIAALPKGPVLLIFFRGAFCPMCHSELDGFEQRLADFAARGIRVVAISVDPPKTAWTFTVLSDPDAAVIREFDLLHRGGGPDGQDIARPAEFLLDSNRVVRWRNLTGSVVRRARPEQVLAAADALGST